MIPCPNCSRKLGIRADQIGHRVACKFCEYVFRLPTHVSVPCPTCGVEGRARTETLGETVRCVECGHGFRAAIFQLPGARRASDAPPPPSAELEAVRAELVAVTRQRDEAQGQLIALDMRLDGVEAELGEARDELAASRKQIAAAETLAAEMATLKSQLDDTRAILAGVQDELDATRERADAVESIGAEMAAMRAERDEALRRIRDLETETSRGLAQPESPQISVLKQQLEAIQDERNELALRLGAAEADREALLFAQTDRRLIAQSDALDQFGPRGDPQLADSLAKLEAETRRAESLESELKAARRRIRELSQGPDATEFGAEDPGSHAGMPEDETPSTIVPFQPEAG